MQIAGQPPAARAVVVGPRDEAMRMARMCYDHIAGRLGLAIAERLLADRLIVFDGDAGHVTEHAAQALERWGIASASAPPRGRPYCRPCLDWSERKPHLAGGLGAMICAHALDQGWLTRKSGSRALTITASGAQAWRELLGLQAWDRVCD